MRLSRSGETFQSKAIITYCLPSMGLGLAFEDMTADQSAVLSRWFAQFNGQPTDDVQFALEDVFVPERQDAATSAAGWREVIGELIGVLIKKHVLTAAEAATIQKKLAE